MTDGEVRSLGVKSNFNRKMGLDSNFNKVRWWGYLKNLKGVERKNFNFIF